MRKKKEEELQEEDINFNYDEYQDSDSSSNDENNIDTTVNQESENNLTFTEEKKDFSEVISKKNIFISLSLIAILIAFLGFYLSQKKVFNIESKGEYTIADNTDMNEPPRKSESDSVKNNTKPSKTGNKKSKSPKKSDDKSSTTPDDSKKDKDDDVDKKDPKSDKDIEAPKDGKDKDTSQNPNDGQGQTNVPQPVPTPGDGKDPVPVPSPTADPKGPGDKSTNQNPDGGGEQKADRTNYVGFNQVCETSYITKNIRGIYFKKMTQQEINRRYVKAKYKNLFDYEGKGNVRDWVEGDKLYIASTKKIYLKNNPGLNNNIAKTKQMKIKLGYDWGWGYNYNFGGADENVFFLDCERYSSLEEIDFENIDTSMLTYIGPMFYNATKLKRILHMENFNTSNVTDFSGMFYNCKSLEYINLSSFDTRKAISMEYMFYGCDKLKTLDLSSFDTSKVQKMNAMLYSKSLQKVYVSSKWTTKSVKDPMDKTHHIFHNEGVLVGGAGTRCVMTNMQAPAAHIDGGQSNPGCLTRK